MITERLSIGLVVACLVFSCADKAHAGLGVVSVVKEELPSAKIVVTGKGYPSRRDISPVQKRLLAQRAATIDAYRVLASTVRGVSGYISDGSGYIQTSGFVRGAEVADMRYFANGKVEVDLMLPVKLSGGMPGGKTDWDTVVASISRRGYSVCYSEKSAKQITEQEWMELRSKE